MRRDISKLVPVGINGARVKKYMTLTLCLCTLVSIAVYLTSFFYKFSKLYYLNEANGAKYLRENVHMPKFFDLTDNVFFCFVFFSIGLVAVAIYNFAYHFIGSKSIYTMLRLNTRKELFVRCLALPVFFALASLFICVILEVGFYVFYIIVVPSQCIVI